MNKQTAAKVLANPKFAQMARQKSLLGWSFSAVMFAVYVVYILFIGIDPHSFAKPVSEGSIITWGIYVGLFVILFAIAITGIYVYLANANHNLLIFPLPSHLSPLLGSFFQIYHWPNKHKLR